MSLGSYSTWFLFYLLCLNWLLEWEGPSWNEWQGPSLSVGAEQLLPLNLFHQVCGSSSASRGCSPGITSNLSQVKRLRHYSCMDVKQHSNFSENIKKIKWWKWRMGFCLLIWHISDVCTYICSRFSHIDWTDQMQWKLLILHCSFLWPFIVFVAFHSPDDD